MKRHSAQFVLFGVVIGGLLGAAVLFARNLFPAASTASRQLPPVVGSRAPEVPLLAMDGSDHTLGELKGKPVLINIWASWCAPCKLEMPLLDRYARAYDGRLVVLGVNAGEDESVIEPYITSLGLHFPIFLDKTGIVEDRYFVRNLPDTFFIDSDGILRAQHLGALTEDKLVRYLETIGITP